MRVNISPKARFLILASITFICVGLIITIISTNEIRNYFVNLKQTEFVDHVQMQAQDFFELDKISTLKNTGDFKKYTETIDRLSGISEATLIDPSGIIIYSENKDLVGTPTTAGGIFVSSLEGKSSVEKIDFKKNEAIFAAPIKSESNDVRGVVIARVEIKDTQKEITYFTSRILLLTGTAAFMFFLITFIIYSDATKSVEEKDRSILDKSKALKEEEELDEAIMSSVAEALVVINKDGQIVVFNPEAEKITGYKSADVEYRLFRKILKFLDKDGKEQTQCPICLSMKNGEVTKVKIKDGFFLKNSEGELIPVTVSVAPIVTGNNIVRGVVANIQNITVEKELDRVKDEFVYVVAHELGNPIFAIDGYLSILDDKLEKADKNTRDILESTRCVNQQLSSLVNDLLEAVRNEQGQLTCEMTKINLTAIIKEVSKSAIFKAREKNIKITYKDTNLPKVIGNEQKIREVITNLIDNAIKYTPSGGKITISHSTESSEIITSITDTGYGMSKEEQEKLFDKFYRIKNNDTKGISGTGLGLFICRQIIEKCNGRIWAESEKSKGSTFSFSLRKAK